jgi:hypothetical protein
MGGAVKTAANVGKIGARAALGRALVVGDIASVLNDNLNPNSDMNKRDAELLRRINQKAQGKYGDRFKNMNGGDSAAKGTKPTPKGVANLPKDLKAQEAALGMKAPSASKPAASKPSSGGSGGRSSGGGGGSAPSRSSSSPAPTIRNPAPQGQSKDMNKNYTDWAKANKGLAEKVKPGQAGYDAIQKALGKTTSSTSEAKPAAKNGSSSAADAAIQSLESDNRAKPFNTDKVAPKTEKERLKQLQALRNAKSKAGVA